MAKDIKILVYPTKDLDKSKALLSKYLETEPYAESPYYVGFRPGGIEVGLDPNGPAVIAYTEVDDIEASLKSLADLGATVYQEPKDVGGGLQIAQVKDADGNILGLRQLPK
ncbi:MAG TPA: hypothetical protein VLF79_03390 [Candidatus Saccharimonadales bacterium]|nr:hypothetical protein [Candidatus Saccharimonadales bacterium]